MKDDDYRIDGMLKVLKDIRSLIETGDREIPQIPLVINKKCTESLTFQQAMDALNNGKFVRRKIWKDGAYILNNKDGSYSESYLYEKNDRVTYKIVGNFFCFKDVLATDWEIVE